ncbi:GRAS family protein [Runella slithyformis]|uniref:GRAS transcription factor n=1 Tax=Runella slithyformis (strain ATCC 29530 / DSM 19594 / LMG 11500 / NCIMB 11436 / LSU 4) TaxID=761193 RepID=A0A7U3ZJ27_RUNSL|nr:GRAS family protein [Runella slithyformis]AEI48167.1 GRAS transcription factor [Runella slithyformis DSM 19594]
MRKHITGGQSNEHIYVQQFEIPQIRLFELLIQQLPLAALTQQCANALLVKSLKNAEYPVLVDIGIGTGMQIVNVLRLLAQPSDCRVKQLTVVGIEPFADAVRAAENNFAELQLPFQVYVTSSIGFVEKMTLTELRALLPAHYDALVVNASFALHHIQLAAQREAVFGYIRDLAPKAFVLSEPVSDHFEPHYATRFHNAVTHYGLVFEVIDSLDITHKEKAALKLFFSREIDDVLGHTEDVRVEKQYAVHQWLELFRTTGFTLEKPITSFQELQEMNGAVLRADVPQRYAVVFKNEELTNVFWAKP